MMDPLITLMMVVFFVTMIFSKIMMTLIINKRRRKNRLEKYDLIIPRDGLKKKKRTFGERKPGLKNLGKGIEKVLNLSKNKKLLVQSGVQLSLGELLIGRVAVAMISMMIAQLYGLHLLIVILCGVIGYHLPIFYLKKRRKKRLQMCSLQLGDALGTMANALRAGFSFMQAMDMVSKEIEDPLGPEFQKAIQDINYGVSVEDAFEDVLKRLPDKDLDIVLRTLMIQRSSGGNLAYLLEMMQETILERFRIKDEVKTLTAQGKMSSIIITLLPIALAFYIRLVNPEYFQMLFSHPVGWLMVIIGSINIVLGWLFIRKIVHIEV